MKGPLGLALARISRFTSGGAVAEADTVSVVEATTLVVAVGVSGDGVVRVRPGRQAGGRGADGPVAATLGAGPNQCVGTDLQTARAITVAVEVHARNRAGTAGFQDVAGGERARKADGDRCRIGGEGADRGRAGAWWRRCNRPRRAGGSLPVVRSAYRVEAGMNVPPSWTRSLFNERVGAGIRAPTRPRGSVVAERVQRAADVIDGARVVEHVFGHELVVVAIAQGGRRIGPV